MARPSPRLHLRETLKAALAGVGNAWRGAGAAMVLCALVWAARPWVGGSLVWLWFGAAAVATLVLSGALARLSIVKDVEAARRGGLGPGGLQFGRLELRLLGGFLLCLLFLVMILSVAALALLALFGSAELDVEAIRARDWAAAGPAWVLGLLALVTAGVLYGVLALIARLSLFIPATAARDAMVSLRAAALSRGQVARLLAGFMIAFSPTLVLAVFSATGLWNSEGWIIWGVALAAVQAPMAIGWLGEVYRRLEAGQGRL